MKAIKATCEAIEALRREKSDTTLTAKITPDGRDWGSAGLLVQHGMAALDEGIPNKQRRRVEAGLRAVIEGAEDLRAWALANGYFQEEVLDNYFHFPRRSEANAFAERLREARIATLFGYKDGSFTIRVGVGDYLRALALFGGVESDHGLDGAIAVIKASALPQEEVIRKERTTAVNTHKDGTDFFLFEQEASAEEFGARLTKAGIPRIITSTGSKTGVWVQKEDIKQAEDIFVSAPTGIGRGVS